MIRPLAGIALSAVLGILLIPDASLPSIAAQPAAKPLTAELTYVPADAAIFVHLDAAQLMDSPIVKSIREVDAKTIDELAAGAKSVFGSSPDSVQSLTLFWPKVKQQDDLSNFGVVGVFKTPYDKAKLEAGLSSLLPSKKKVKIVAVSAQVAVMLVGLDEATFGKPQGVKEGPQTAALREAGSGRHLLSIGVVPGQLPDEIRGDNLPEEVRAFQPLFTADSLAGFLDLGKELSVDIRVKSATPPRAKDAEKSLGFLMSLASDTLGQALKELRKDAVKDADAQELIALLAAIQSSAKEAKFTTEGETTRMVAKTTAQLPFAKSFLAAKRTVQEAAARSTSSNNLKQMLIAMHNYASANNDSFPPAAVCDKKGKPILSWRVLILPYVEQENLYKQFKLDEAWDSENNKKLIAKMPKLYAVPGAPNAKPNETHYRAFVGNGAAFDYLKGPRFTDFTDGLSNTLMIATAKDSVIWTKPDDLDFDAEKDATKLLGLFPGKVSMVAFADGSVRSLSPKITKVTLHAMITRSGGEVVTDDE